MNYSKEQNTSLIMYKFSSPSKPKPNRGDISTNEYEGLTTAEQCDQLYLNNMNISKLQNSNCTGSGSFAPINNVSICSFRVNEDILFSLKVEYPIVSNELGVFTLVILLL